MDKRGKYQRLARLYDLLDLPFEYRRCQPLRRELGRLCRNSGEIRILEYAISENPVRRAVMALWAPWVKAVYGAGFDRRTEDYVADAGLELVESRYLLSDIIKLLVVRPA